jgi:hypothetical protein
MSTHVLAVWQPETGEAFWNAHMTQATFTDQARAQHAKGFRLVSTDVSDGAYAAIWRPGTGAEYFFSGSVSDAADKDRQFFGEGLRLVSLSLHANGVLCVWHPGSGAQRWQSGMSLEAFKTLDAQCVAQGLRLVAVDEWKGQFAAVWQMGAGVQYWQWGPPDEIAEVDAKHSSEGLRIKTIGGHHGRVIAVWRPQTGAQRWVPRTDLASITSADALYAREGLRMTMIRLHADPSVKNPRMNAWTLLDTQEIDNEDWTEECQGFVTDGSSWLVTSNNDDFKGIYRLSLDLQLAAARVALPVGRGDHVGSPALDFGAGRVYVPVEGPTGIWVIDKGLQTLSIAAQPAIAASQNSQMPWCTISPWNGLLYSSAFDRVNQVYAYDPARSFALVETLQLGGPALDGVQAGCISDNGHLYLVSDRSGSIHGYDVVSGQSLGTLPIPYSPGGVDGEELEGIALGQLTHANGAHSWVHVLVLDNDVTNDDDVFIKHYSVSHPELL